MHTAVLPVTAATRLRRIMTPYPYHATWRLYDKVYILLPGQLEDIRRQVQATWPDLVPLIRTEDMPDGTSILSVHVRGTIARVRYVAEAS